MLYVGLKVLLSTFHEPVKIEAAFGQADFSPNQEKMTPAAASFLEMRSRCPSLGHRRGQFPCFKAYFSTYQGFYNLSEVVNRAS